MQSDSELVKIVLSGDRQAYGSLFLRHQRSVQAIALAVLGDYHAAQDATQQAFVTAYTRLRGLRKASSFGPWIRKIARNEAIQIARAANKQNNAQPPAQRAGTPPNDGEVDEPNRRLLDAVMRLPRHEREVIMLRYFEDHSVKTIGQMTARPIGTVTMQLSRARAHLQKLLKESSS